MACLIFNIALTPLDCTPHKGSQIQRIPSHLNYAIVNDCTPHKGSQIQRITFSRVEIIGCPTFCCEIKDSKGCTCTKQNT